LDDGPDGRDDAWYQFLNDLDDLLALGTFTWAEETLAGIRRVVEHSGRVTPAQRQALANIANHLWPSRWLGAGRR